MTRADVKSQIVVKQVASPVTSDPWEIHETSFMLMECDSRAQRSFFRTFEFDSFVSKQFSPPLVEPDWYGLVGLILEGFLLVK